MRVKGILFNLLILFGMTLIFSGCAGTRSTVRTSLPGVPDWFLNPPQEEGMLYGTGQAQKQSLSLAKTTADNRAIEAVAQQIKTNVRSMFKDFMQQTGTDTDAEYIETTEKTIKNVVNLTLTGVKIIKRAVGPDGKTVYSLVGIPMSEVKKMVVQTVKKDSSLTKLRASKSFQELDREMGSE